MALFDLGAAAFQAGICVTWAELLGQWLLVPGAFRFGPSIGSLEVPSDCPPGLATPRRDHSVSLMYRVLPGNISVFRRPWTGWFQSPFSIHGRASWSRGRLRIVARHPTGPWIVVMGLFSMAADATLGFLRQGEPLSAALAALSLGGAAALIPLYSYRSARGQFSELTTELRTELGYAPVRTSG
jgi:hypothetical protein